ncbi:MAG TPA: tRNA uridine-5-carboxymethylaminomethyl(34) synthesis GTPase MnmE [Verrucomicrobiae bacterium]|nr:tRNA uridine-5-carboxymethylaminomethyl(34) synthesis GTPase MnmE [Verrucomicrobiae bacterium]
MEDTIAAISTPVGESGIAIIRISGPLALTAADRIFHSRTGCPSGFPSHTIHFGTVGTNGDTIDQVMLTVMRAPRTYTKEDTVEINCHGGVLTARKLLSLCLQNGARLAEPGEFTKRAFLNGRIDLAQAEAVMDIIRARTDRAHQCAVHELQGRLSNRVDEARERLISILAHIEAHIDFPEEDISPNNRENLLRETKAVFNQLRSLLATFREGRILRDGLPVAIIGRPNVGKSSLLNALLGENRAIVTPIPGTTRDTLEEYVNIGGIPFRFTDTAGIRRPRGRVESMGVERATQAVEKSDVVLLVLDGSQPFRPADLEIQEKCGTKPVLLILNKADLPNRLRIPKELCHMRSVSVSALTGLGVCSLCDSLLDIAHSGICAGTNFTVAINERHHEVLVRATDALTSGVQLFERGDELELICQQLRIALNAVGEITGKTATEDILQRVFSTFCVGK